VAFEEVARVFFDDGVEMLVCCGEGVERVGGERGVEVGFCVGEDGEEDFGWESVEARHAAKRECVFGSNRCPGGLGSGAAEVALAGRWNCAMRVVIRYRRYQRDAWHVVALEVHKFGHFNSLAKGGDAVLVLRSARRY